MAALVWALAGPTAALSTDRDQPINIEADRAEADDLKRVTIYRGEVVITQGTMRITGDTVWIYYDEGQELTKLVSVGNPAHFRQLPDGEQTYQTADAKRLEWYANEDLVVMLGNARYGEGKDRVVADRIVYDSVQGRMKADSTVPAAAAAGERQRVRIDIQPKEKTTTP